MNKPELKPAHHRGMTWLGRMRLRIIVLLIGIPLAVLGAISIGPAWMTLPLVGVAVAAVTYSVGRTAQRLELRCWTCGQHLSADATSEHGIECSSCGSLNQHRHLAATEGHGDELFNVATDSDEESVA